MRHPVTLFMNVKTMLKDESGATMIEYALMVTFIAMVAFAAVQTLGINLNTQYTTFSGLFP